MGPDTIISKKLEKRLKYSSKSEKIPVKIILKLTRPFDLEAMIRSGKDVKLELLPEDKKAVDALDKYLTDIDLKTVFYERLNYIVASLNSEQIYQLNLSEESRYICQIEDDSPII